MGSLVESSLERVGAMPRRSVSNSVDYKVGQRVLFRHHTRRTAQWLSGVISGGPRSQRGRICYQVKLLDNGETRYGAAGQFRKAGL
jgi:hypothetical protein